MSEHAGTDGPFRSTDATRQHMARVLDEAERREQAARAEANQFPRASNEAEHALKRAAKHAEHVRRLQWAVENTDRPASEWSEFRTPGEDGWAR